MLIPGLPNSGLIILEIKFISQRKEHPPLGSRNTKHFRARIYGYTPFFNDVRCFRNSAFFAPTFFGCIKTTVNSGQSSLPTHLTAAFPPKCCQTASKQYPTSHQPSHLIGQDEGSVSQQWWPPTARKRVRNFEAKNGEQRQHNPDMTFAWNTEGSYSDPHNGCH